MEGDTREHLIGLGFTGTQADPDIWRHPARKDDGMEYYELCLVYVDDILLVSHDPKQRHHTS